MAADSTVVRCADCNQILEEDPSLPADERTVCPGCGSMARRVDIHVHEELGFKSQVAMKGRHSGEKKPYVEQVDGDDLQRSTGRWMKKSRTIDRDGDRYTEKVVDPETGEVLRDVDEPLTQHRGRGSAKKATIRKKR